MTIRGPESQARGPCQLTPPPPNDFLTRGNVKKLNCLTSMYNNMYIRCSPTPIV